MNEYVKIDRYMCRYVWINTEVCLYMCWGTCECMPVCVYTWVHAVRNTQECMFTCIQTRVHACMHMWVHASVHSHMWVLLVYAQIWCMFLVLISHVGATYACGRIRVYDFMCTDSQVTTCVCVPTGGTWLAMCPHVSTCVGSYTLSLAADIPTEIP